MSTQTQIDPQSVPTRTLNTGSKMPAIGLGTFGSDHVTNETVAEAVKAAIDIGYRHIDCASVYGNEAEIGAALKEVIDAGKVSREDLWITSKLWNDKHAEEDVLPSLRQTLADLQLDYLDLYLVHWPFPNFHAKGCDVDSRSELAKPYINENFMKTWRQMEKAVELGLVKNIGTSNMTQAKLEVMLPEAKIKPAVNEMEIHPHFQQQELYDYVVSQGIQPVGFCPIGSPARPERDKTAEDTVDTEDPVLREIAEKHGLHPATLCVKWAEQRGQIPIPFSTNPRNMAANLASVVGDPLTDEEMEALSKIDKNCRLIKGQVFLWKDDQSWEDLWDLDGVIAQ
ncbi:aldo/keto reductase [Pelagicoccus mobilis]|uniref:Aldo/keto reductase n=1 Tax=Pelagicoccus mobilis TaxID=415221 RepID=A0A934RZP9_9BACT|nr:aldo/keto reductase [Pelagicoccus mobilis]MBK1879707.1 aldo/keto reductase [Pelagicoccus mobilis]